MASTTANYHILPDGRAWSYGTALVDRLTDPSTGNTLTLGNITRYSATTSKHQTWAGVRSCDILLTNVPRAVSDLARWYLSLTPAERESHTAPR